MSYEIVTQNHNKCFRQDNEKGNKIKTTTNDDEALTIEEKEGMVIQGNYKTLRQGEKIRTGRCKGQTQIRWERKKTY